MEPRRTRNGNVRRTRYVYLLVNPLNGRPFYVGSTTDPAERLSTHGCSFDDTGRRNIIDAIKGAGHEITMVILEIRKSATASDIHSAESLWIEIFLRSGALLVNKEASERTRKEALADHLKAIETKDSRPKTEPKPRKPLVLAESLPSIPQPIPPIHTAPRQFPSIPRPAPPANKPARHGQPWAEDEVISLCTEFMCGATADALAISHQRTLLAVVAKLKSRATDENGIARQLIDLGLVNEDGQTLV